MLGIAQCKIQKGSGSGTITIDAVDTSKSIVLTSVSTTAVFASSTSITVGVQLHGQ